MTLNILEINSTKNVPAGAGLVITLIHNGNIKELILGKVDYGYCFGTATGPLFMLKLGENDIPPDAMAYLISRQTEGLGEPALSVTVKDTGEITVKNLGKLALGVEEKESAPVLSPNDISSRPRSIRA